MSITADQLHHELTAFGRGRVQTLRRVVGHGHGDPLVTVSLLLALGSRETNLQNIEGDGGHGKGWLQVDDRSHAAWLRAHAGCRSGHWSPEPHRDALEHGYVPCLTPSAQFAVALLHTNLGAVRLEHVHDHQLWTAVAGYNCGVTGAIEGLRRHGNPDHFTTGRDYGRDVLDRMHVVHRELSDLNWI